MQRTIYHTELIDQILAEVKDQNEQHRFPDHPCAMASMVSIPAGNLVNHAAIWKYHRAETEEGREEQIQAMRTAAIAVCAQSIRFIENLPK